MVNLLAATPVTTAGGTAVNVLDALRMVRGLVSQLILGRARFHGTPKSNQLAFKLLRGWRRRVQLVVPTSELESLWTHETPIDSVVRWETLERC